ncbi:MAG: GNAT family N-acetyltransferase [Sphingomonadales bacterium]
MKSTARFWPQRLSPRRVVNAIRHSRVGDWLWSHRYLVIYRSDRKQSESMAALSDRLRANSFEDLEKFDQSERWLTRDQFLANARERIADGEVVLTATADEKLIYYTWLVPGQRNNYFPFVDQSYQFPEGSVISYNSYTHPDARGQGLHKSGLRAISHWALSQPDINYVYGAIEIDNRASRHCSESVGRRPFEVLYRKSRFGRVTKGSLPPSFVRDYDARRG